MWVGFITKLQFISNISREEAFYNLFPRNLGNTVLLCRKMCQISNRHHLVASKKMQLDWKVTIPNSGSQLKD